MKKILVIGSTVVDIIINLDYIPKTGQSINIRSQEMSLGGCAYNVSDTLRHFNVPYILFSPIGTGVYGDYVRNELSAKNITTPIPTPNMDNGCCYCFIEATGERTFVSNHGAEYLIHKEWLDTIDTSQIESIYVCGIDVEDATGNDIVEFLEKNKNIPIFFAPGPRIKFLSENLLNRIISLSPILHCNESEAYQITKQNELLNSVKHLYNTTKNVIIITCGSKGAYYYDGMKLTLIEAVKANQIDTNGAGDAHIGAIMACYYKKYDMEKSIKIANLVSSAVVETKGALLSDERFDVIKNKIESI